MFKNELNSLKRRGIKLIEVNILLYLPYVTCNSYTGICLSGIDDLDVYE